jgi:hypothetical protein
MNSDKNPYAVKEMVWRSQPINNHLWAFYYFCKKQGDRVRLVRNGDGTADLIVWRLSADSQPDRP